MAPNPPEPEPTPPTPPGPPALSASGRAASLTLRCTPLVPLLPRMLALRDEKAHDAVRRAEALHDALEPDASYPLDFVAYRLTGFRRDQGDAALLFGEPLAHDLRQLIDALSRRSPLPADDQTTRPAQAWANELGVHPRTLRRWRADGLRWRWFRAEGQSRAAAGYTQDAVDRFRRLHPERFETARGFTQLCPAQRQAVTDQAAKLARQNPDLSLSAAAQRIAEPLGRAHETIRQILLHHDARPGVAPLFPHRPPGLTRAQHRAARHANRQGQSLRSIAQSLGKSAPTLHRILLAHRAKRLRRLPLRYIASPLFDRPDAQDVFLRDTPPPTPPPNPRDATPAGWSQLLDSLAPSARVCFQAATPLADPDRRARFLRMNFLKHRAHHAIQQLPKDAELRTARLAAIEQDVRDAGQARRQLVAGGLGLLLSLVRRQAGQDASQTVALAQLLRSGLSVLVEAVDTFNASGNIRFETYLRNRLQRGLAVQLNTAKPPTDTPNEQHAAPVRASRRDAPTPAEQAWARLQPELLRWVGPPASHQPPAA